MHPELFHIGPVPIRSYGLMLAISFFLGIWYVSYISKRDGKPFEPFLAISYIMIIGGIVGSRIFYVISHLEEFAGNWATTFNPFASSEFGIAGLTLYGGILLAIAGTFVYCRWQKLSVLEMFDYFAPSLGLGLFFTRIGCFLNGCCFGTPTDVPWGVSFPVGSIPYYFYGNQNIHPAQLYSSLYGLLLFVVLHLLLKRRQFVGQLVAVLFMVEAVFRFAIEYVRYYEDAMYFSIFTLHPTYNQVVSVLLFVLGAGIYVYQMRRLKSAVQPTDE